MARRPSREERHYANLAVALAADAAAKKPSSPVDAHARFLAVGGAHVVVALDESEWYRMTCEACGQLPGGSASGEFVATDAQKHAEICRRIPERLWPKQTRP